MQKADNGRPCVCGTAGAIRAVLFAFVLLTFVANAQDITKGSIAGVVKDQSGAVVPDAKVQLTSPFGQRSTTTGPDGQYVFPNLIVGTGYTISVEKAGFQSSKLAGLSVKINQRSTADVTLAVGGEAQTIEVVGGGPQQIDATSTTVGATLDSSLYQQVAMERNISSLLYMAPGVADGIGTGTANPAISGATGLENMYVVNGTNLTDPGFGGFGTYSRIYGSLGTGVNFDFADQVQVQTGGFEAQYGQALGGIVNVLTKSGGNEFHGGLYGYFQPRQFEAGRKNINLVTVTQHTQLTNRGRYDFGGDLGGYLIKNKLFFYGGFNPVFLRSYREAPPAFANSQLGEVVVKDRSLNYTGKVNFEINPNHSFEGSVFGDPSTTPVGFTRFTSLASNDDFRTSGRDYGSRTWTGRYNGVLKPWWVVSANFSQYFNSFTEYPKYNGYEIIDNVPLQDGTGGQVIRNGVGFLEGTESRTNQFAVTSSHTFHLVGSHTLQLGYQFENDVYDDNRLYTGPSFQIPNLPEFGVAAGKTQYGAALIRTHMNPADPTSPIVLQVTRGDYSNPVVGTLTRYHAGFIEDAWSIGPRLTLKPGIRYEYQSMSGNALRYVFAPNWAPRIGVIFDPTGKRNSKVYVNWGRFYEKIPLDIAVRSFSFESSVRGAWYKDPGPNGTVDLSASSYIPGGNIGFSGGPDALTLVAGGTKAQYQDEVIGGYDTQLAGGWAFSGRFVYRHMRRILEDISGVNVTQYLAGVPQQYVVANPSASLDIFKNAYPCNAATDSNCDPATGFTAITNPLGSDGVSDGFPNPSRIYQAMELVVSKRLSANWQLYANYTLSKLWGNFEGSYRNDNQQQDPNISSLFDFTNTDGRLADQYLPGVLPADRRHSLKLFSNYQFTRTRLKNLNVGLSWQIQSGIPISKLLAHPAYDNAGEIPAGARGIEGRTPWTFPVGLHSDYTLAITEHRRLKLVADLFNLFNQGRVTRVDQNFQLNSGTPNPDFLKPDGTDANFEYPWQNPFSARLGVRFEF